MKSGIVGEPTCCSNWTRYIGVDQLERTAQVAAHDSAWCLRDLQRLIHLASSRPSKNGGRGIRVESTHTLF